MILRNAAVRNGRKTIAAPVTRSWRCALSTETTAPPPTKAAPQPSRNRPDPSTIPAYKLAAQKLIDAKNDAIPENFRIFRTIQNKTMSLGSKVEKEYVPQELINNPPSEATLELLMASQAHLGHNVALWNPVNARYIYGERHGIHIISLEQTLSHLRRATRVVEEVAYYGGLILFAGTRKSYTDIVVKAAQLAGGCHLFQKWTPGSITNRDHILRSSGIRVVDENDKPIPGFDRHIQERRPLVPDLVVCLNPLENYTMLYECGLANVPTIGIIDTNGDPSWVTYPIPGNDDSLRTGALIAGILARAGQRGQRRRLKDAESGIVTWENPPEVSHFIQQDARRKADEIAKAAEMELAAKKFGM